MHIYFFPPEPPQDSAEDYASYDPEPDQCECSRCRKACGVLFGELEVCRECADSLVPLPA